eukprot:Gregarina_sp_Poly_1__10958@NODE_862_length_5940_cov_638_515410_g285_i2_p3_GENE_NODE_862_length_5940_cov_638_515410_g285_i2NODE_862_length_5940_cov_638_515410_g285_i2_p3_ORF_typecomplete_len362_score63_31Ins_P5_2kin/PF06090_12/0_99_NODE_862_length_5940_cov_638_515410_g285_i21291214
MEARGWRCRLSKFGEGGSSTVYVLRTETGPCRLENQILKLQKNVGENCLESLLDTLRLQESVRNVLMKTAVKVPAFFELVRVRFIGPDIVDLQAETVETLHFGREDKILVGVLEERIPFIFELKLKSPLPISTLHNETRFSLEHPTIEDVDFRVFAESLCRQDAVELSEQLRLMHKWGRLRGLAILTPEDLEKLTEILLSLSPVIMWVWRHVALSEGVAVEALTLHKGCQSSQFTHRHKGLRCSLIESLLPFNQEKENAPFEMDLNVLLESQRGNERLAKKLVSNPTKDDIDRFLAQFILGRIFADVSLLFDEQWNCFMIDFDTAKGSRKFQKWADDFVRYSQRSVSDYKFRRVPFKYECT